MKIIIMGDPVAQKRHRYRKMGNFIQEYDPQAQEKKRYKEVLEALYLKEIADHLDIVDMECCLKPSELFLGKLFHVDLTFHTAMPKSFSKRKKEAMTTISVFNPKRPDLDNYIKFFNDAAIGILWPDDNSLVSLSARKLYSDCPRTEIILEPLKEPYHYGKTLT